MNFSGVDFPSEIINALEQDKLVVFAGAGISQGPPSNLDDFYGLTKKIGRGASPPFDEKKEELPEVFLGRLEKEGVPVIDRLHQFLMTPNSLPKEIHSDVLRFFKTSERCKIVTTNYDTHFETASDNLFDTAPKIYASPALPLGRDFYGIVHVHGYLGEDHNGIVLTDKGFGRAYFTEGWAREFIRGVFENYHILFIGYSYNDTVLRYLSSAARPARGLKRYALIGDKASNEIWTHLDITPITFPQENKDDFSALDESVHKLSNYLNLGAANISKRLKTIISTNSQLTQTDSAYLLHHLSKPYGINVLCKHASDFYWVEWANDNELLNFVTEQRELTENEYKIANWLIDFCFSHPEKMRIFLFGKNQKLNRSLGLRIRDELFHLDQKNISLKEGKVMLNRWISLLRSNFPDYLKGHTGAPFNTLIKFNALKTFEDVYLDCFLPIANVRESNWFMDKQPTEEFSQEYIVA